VSYVGGGTGHPEDVRLVDGGRELGTSEQGVDAAAVLAVGLQV